MWPGKNNTLEKYSLSCIVANFGKLIHVYNSGSECVPQKCFEFLQRRYSATIWSKLSEKQLMRVEYVPFLINRYLKHVDLTKCMDIAVIDAVMKRLKHVGRGITSLDATGENFHPKCTTFVLMELISSVPNVEELYLACTHCTDWILCWIKMHCASLHTLDVSENEITTKGLRDLCRIDKNGRVKANHVLRKLCIKSTRIDVNGVLFALTYFPALDELVYENVGGIIFKLFCGTPIENLHKYNLQKLNIKVEDMTSGGTGREPKMGDILRLCSILCPKLSHLFVNSAITQNELLRCTEFPQLNEITLNSSSRKDDLLRYAPLLQVSGKHLTKMHLSNGVVSVKVLCECCPNLEKLRLSWVCFEDIMVTPEPAFFSRLKFLCCKGMDLQHELRDSILFLVNSSPVLEVLCLLHCRYVTNSILSSLLNYRCMATLKRIDFHFSDKTFSAVYKLVTVCISLEDMYIECCGIERSEFVSFKKLLKSKNCCIVVSWNPFYDYHNSQSDSDSDDGGFNV